MVWIRPTARGCNTPPNLPIGPLLATKLAKNVFFPLLGRGLRGGGEVQKVHFWVQKVNILGSCNFPPPQKKNDPGYEPGLDEGSFQCHLKVSPEMNQNDIFSSWYVKNAVQEFSNGGLRDKSGPPIFHVWPLVSVKIHTYIKGREWCWFSLWAPVFKFPMSCQAL